MINFIADGLVWQLLVNLVKGITMGSNDLDATLPDLKKPKKAVVEAAQMIKGWYFIYVAITRVFISAVDKKLLIATCLCQACTSCNLHQA